jgi:type II secretory pathway pseudopilin PulG
MLEILIVVGVMAVLIAISIPAIGHFKTKAKAAAVTEQLSGLGLALENYHQEFNVYPPSAILDVNKNPAMAYNVIGIGRAPALLAEALTGYLPGIYDGAGESGSFYMGESPFGFRTKGNASTGTATGKVYGPYAALKNLLSNPGTPVADSDQSFVDAYGNEILYFRSTHAGNDLTGLLPVTRIFGTDPNIVDYYFVANDNQTVPPGQSGARPTPINAKRDFFRLLGADGNNIGTAASAVTGAHSYLLISAGPDGIPFTGDDVVLAR